MVKRFDLTEEVQQEIVVIQGKLNDVDDKNEFETFLQNCLSVEDVEALLIRYRHLIPELYDPLTWGTTTYEPINRPICIAYLLNEDKIFYSELDSVICNYLRNEGAKVVTFKMADFCYKGGKDGIEIYINNKVQKFDGFLTYGYRKKSSMEVYYLIAHIMEVSGAVCLHDRELDLVINNKLLQSIKYAKANVPIPDTFETFNSKTSLELIETIDPTILPCVLKPLDDYGGEGLSKYSDKYEVVNTLNRTFWKGRQLLIQKLVPDSIGHSIRVLCFDGKAFACAEYEDNSGGFTSNFCYGDKFRLYSLMDHPKADIYKDVAERAIKSLGTVLIGGVDLLDSKENGVVVLEVNGWPDIFDIWFQTNRCGFKQLAISFMNKIKKSFNTEQVSSTNANLAYESPISNS